MKFFSLADHGWPHLRSLLGLFSLGKFMNHFWKVKSNPENIQQNFFLHFPLIFKSWLKYLMIVNQQVWLFIYHAWKYVLFHKVSKKIFGKTTKWLWQYCHLYSTLYRKKNSGKKLIWELKKVFACPNLTLKTRENSVKYVQN